jgi:hypothetical protein
MNMRLLQGRAFDANDSASRPAVAIVSRSLASYLFPSGDAIGQRVTWHHDWTVIGIVGDARLRRVDERPQFAMYVPAAQADASFANGVVLRTQTDFETASAAVSRAVRAVDPDQPIESIVAVGDVVKTTAAAREAYARFATVLAGVAFLTVLLCIYATASHAARARRGELAIRLVLGAAPRRLLATTLRDAFRPVAIGTAVGLGVMLVLRSGLEAVLFETSVSDPLTIAATCALLTVATLAAWAWPAREVARIDPAATLRDL